MPTGPIGFRVEAGLENGTSTNIEVNVFGGFLGNSFNANSGSTINIVAGEIGTGFRALPGSTVEVSGGTINSQFSAAIGSSLTLVGAEFLVNGVAANPSEVTLGNTDALGGTLQDGTTFVFSPQALDRINNVVLETVALPAIDLTPIRAPSAGLCAC